MTLHLFAFDDFSSLPLVRLTAAESESEIIILTLVGAQLSNRLFFALLNLYPFCTFAHLSIKL